MFRYTSAIATTTRTHKMIKIASTLLILLSQTSKGFSTAINYPHYDLAEFCGRTITVPCPYATGEGGTLKFISRPRKPCRVELRLTDPCIPCANDPYSNILPKYGFYLNFRNATKYQMDAIHLRSVASGKPVMTLLPSKSLSSTANPPSVTQYKTPLANVGQAPSIFIEYMPAFTLSEVDDSIDTNITIDYVVTESLAGQYQTAVLCSALQVYVSRRLICDSTDNRINCPRSYEFDANSYTYKPAQNRSLQCTSLPAPPSPFSTTNPTINVEQRCNDVITFPCPTEAKPVSGSLAFRGTPRKSCEVTVQLQDNCTNSMFHSFAIYLNIRQIVTGGNGSRSHALEIYEGFGNNRTLGKTLKQQNVTSFVPSVSQYITSYDRQPRIHLLYRRKSDDTECDSKRDILIDFTVLLGTDQPGSQSTYCGALRGFIHNSLLCEQQTTRIYCPRNYEDSLGLNPAEDSQCVKDDSRVTYQRLALNWKQNTLTIPCPDALYYQRGRVGNLTVTRRNVAFSVNISLPSNCGTDNNDTFAFYFNIKRGRSVSILKQYPGEPDLRREKQIAQSSSSDLSIAQYLSPYEKQPSVVLAFEPLGDIYLDYAVYSKRNRTGYSGYCPTLEGALTLNLLCDSNGNEDRINCPYSYIPTEGMNPANARFCTK
ncbi:uncharacterized protein LOC129584362 [Paramacrobiotus metropolitanus]|uniref:uncharacterized protein LOC129584362 n=1 Tax=Paramacrobiotus metropolitanus TaxID=2943436 RepID=UPI002445D4C5|nr:uncharacterized protein LOC129584362 [Paramacrobiotus metropolitanus]